MKVIKCHKDTLDEPSASSSSFISTKANPVGRRATYESDRYISNIIFEKKIIEIILISWNLSIFYIYFLSFIKKKYL